jgi:hypothetical protein
MTKLEQLDLLLKAKKRWQESEKILNILRTLSAKPLKELTDEELLSWHQKNSNPSQSFAN